VFKLGTAGGSLLALAAALACAPCPGLGWDPELPEPPDIEGAEPMLGAPSCTTADADCNVCAPGVEAQFSSGEWQGALQHWQFHPDAAFDVRPRDAYYAHHRGHVQGFVQLNLPDESYAMVHSIGRHNTATLSFIGKAGDGLALQALYRMDAPGGHTSGAFALGNYVGVIEQPLTLALFDGKAALRRTPPFVRHLELSNPKACFADSPKNHGLTDWSGGVAMAKLANGRYLLLANTGGASSGTSHFFELEGLGTQGTKVPVATRELGQSGYATAPLLCQQHYRSENAALITECGTGHIYAVHIGSNDDMKTLDLEPGTYHTFWRLSQLVTVAGVPELVPVGAYVRRAHLAYCHGRSAGSVHVDPRTRRITLLCHERDQVDANKGPWYFWAQANGTSP
jgi:hypothetical protein